MQFHGFCSYPHGGYVTFGLLLACLAGTGASWYAFASCRFVVLNYATDLGPFNQMFDNRGAGDVEEKYQIAAGLFSWLQPYNRRGAISWNDGRCTGYTRNQREGGFGDDIFEVARVFAVITVLLSISIFLWVLITMCVSMGRCHIRLLSMVLLLSSITTGMSMLVLRSGLCNNVGNNTECSLDEGGLVAIAAIILWFVAFLIALLFVVPVGEDLILVEGELRSDFEERQAARKRKEELRRQAQLERRIHREEEAVYQKEQRQRQRAERHNRTTPNKSKKPDRVDLGTPDTFGTVEDESGTEVYIKRRLDNIEDMVDSEYEI